MESRIQNRAASLAHGRAKQLSQRNSWLWLCVCGIALVPDMSSAPAFAASPPQGRGRAKLQDALVWVDCEMTGLGAAGGPGNDVLLEVACLITDGDLKLVAEGPDLVIHYPDATLDSMNDWCKKQFGWNGIGVAPKEGGLAEEVQKSKISIEAAEQELLDFVSQHVDKGKGILAGNTVHMDKRFLDKFTPRFTQYLHYRLVDVSTMKELCRRWCPREFQKCPAKRGSHRALDDIRESLAELRYYREAMIVKPPQ
mmetsp:Transcript_30077/g.70108  ORF Transcript_30077/g.70108 Transcript_30077/m.70108 type:complete len:254 (+) Transcript_30077:38-799(+)